MTTTADRIDTDRSTTPRHTWRTETTTSRTRPVDQGGDTPMMLTQLLDLHEASDALGEAIPCRENDAELWFADTPDGVEFAKALCGTCPARDVCLSGALGRRALRPGRHRRPQASSRTSPQDRRRRLRRPVTFDHQEIPMYFRRMQRIRRTAHQRRVHEAQRQVQAAAEREQLRAVIHSHVR